MGKWIAEFELEDGDTMPEHMDLNYNGAKIDFYCRPLNQETCEDAVSRQAVITVVKDWWEKGVIAIDDIRELPPVTPTRKVGEWIYHEKSISTGFKSLRECSCCHCYFRWEMPRNSYCPNCGSDMRGSDGKE